MEKEPILLRFGKNVQEYRKARQLSQEQLAELAGVHRTYIGMIERAEKNIKTRLDANSDKTLIRIRAVVAIIVALSLK